IRSWQPSANRASSTFPPSARRWVRAPIADPAAPRLPISLPKPCGRRFMQPNELIAPGQVWLVGAGPGDPDLLTRKAEKLIVAAQIVFHDALVGPGVLDLIPEGVERVSVGKRSGRHSKAQENINDLLLTAARAGKRVVRLKGGDPSVFGRSAEEMAHLAEEGIGVSICPGITTASA